MLRWLLRGIGIRSDYRAVKKNRVPKRIGKRVGHRAVNKIFKY